MLIVVGAVVGIRNSRTGRVLVALRENERAAASYGVSVVRAKLTAFALSGFIAAIAGVLLVVQNGRFTLGLFPESDNLVVFTAAVVGGLGSVTGSAIGALFLKGGDWFLADVAPVRLVDRRAGGPAAGPRRPGRRPVPGPGPGPAVGGPPPRHRRAEPGGGRGPPGGAGGGAFEARAAAIGDEQRGDVVVPATSAAATAGGDADRPHPAADDPRPWPERFTTAGPPGAVGARPDRHRPALALLILTGLNAVDELARSSFSVVAPTIADHFGVGLAGVTMPFVLAAAALALSVPIAGLADRATGSAWPWPAGRSSRCAPRWWAWPPTCGCWRSSWRRRTSARR